MQDLVLLVFFPALMAYAAFSDLFTMTIPNRVSLLLLGGFFAMAALTGMGIWTVAMHVGVALAVLVLTFSFFAMGWMGGGDAKLASTTALWLGLGAVFDYLALTAILGGVLTLGLFWVRSYDLPSVFHKQAWLVRLCDKQSGIPYGIALAISGLLVFPHSPLFTLVANAPVA